MNKQIIALLSVVVVAVVLVFFFAGKPGITQPTPTMNSSPTTTPSPTASLSPTLAPRVPNISVISPVNVNVGDRFTVSILADSDEQLIDGLDALLIVSPNLRVVGYTPTNILPVHNFNTILPASNNFNFSQITNGGQSIAITGVIATLQVEALVSGPATINIDFTVGSTRDSNMAQNGLDILEQVTNAAIIIK